MPKLLKWSETCGCGATIGLDSKEVVFVSIAQTGVLVRLVDARSGLLRAVISNFTGPKLYDEKNVYKNARTAETLSFSYPPSSDLPTFKNPVLAAFASAIWNCGTAAEVTRVLNEAFAKAPPLAEGIPFGVAERSPARTYRVHFSDGVSQERRFIPAEIDEWAVQTNKDGAGKYRIVRIVDENNHVVWGG